MKDKFLANVDDYFVYEDLEAIFPNHPRSSIMARVHELISQGLIERVRLAKSKKRAIYKKVFINNNDNSNKARNNLIW